MKKSIAVLSQEFINTVKYIEHEIRNAVSLDCSDPMREQSALTVAVRLRMLLSDDGANKSLLRQVGLHDNIYFPGLKDNEVPSNLVFTSKLAHQQIKDGKIYFVNNEFGDFTTDILYTFDCWWNEIVIDSKHQTRSHISRRDIVLVLSDKQGGAHTDSKYDEAHRQALFEQNIQFVDNNGKVIPTQNDVFVESILFIGHELVNAVKLYNNELCKSVIKTAKCSYKILVETYFVKKLHPKTNNEIIEKRYRFFRVHEETLSNSLLLFFDHYQKASYRLLDLTSFQALNSDSIISGYVVDITKKSQQILLLRAQGEVYYHIILKDESGYLSTDNPYANNYSERKILAECIAKINPLPHAFDECISKQIVDEP